MVICLTKYAHILILMLGRLCTVVLVGPSTVCMVMLGVVGTHGRELLRGGASCGAPDDTGRCRSDLGCFGDLGGGQLLD